VPTKNVRTCGSGKGVGEGVDRLESQRYMARNGFISSLVKRSFDQLVHRTYYGNTKAFATVRLAGNYLYFTRPEIYHRQQVERKLERAKLIGYLRR
jgi:hypothetical protein